MIFALLFDTTLLKDVLFSERLNYGYEDATFSSSDVLRDSPEHHLYFQLCSSFTLGRGKKHTDVCAVRVVRYNDHKEQFYRQPVDSYGYLKHKCTRANLFVCTPQTRAYGL
jgi:hypothetical protein